MKKGGYFTDYSILGRSPLFRGIPAGDFGVLLEHLKAETRSYNKGDLICHAGEHTNALGIMLLVDGIGKMPLAVDALSVYSPYRFWVLISAVLPLILGIVLLVNPFRAAKAAIMFFGISILADGLFELITYIQQRRAEKSEYKDIR